MSHTYHVPQLVKAPFWKRFCAGIIDAVFLALLFFLFMVILGVSSRATPGLNALVYNLIMLVLFGTVALLYEPILLSTKGATLGKMMMHIWVLTEAGKKPSLGRALLRTVARIASGIVLNIGYFWVAVDANRQGWHDKIAGTYVIAADETNTPLIGKTAKLSTADLITLVLFALITLGGMGGRSRQLSSVSSWTQLERLLQQRQPQNGYTPPHSLSPTKRFD